MLNTSIFSNNVAYSYNTLSDPHEMNPLQMQLKYKTTGIQRISKQKYWNIEMLFIRSRIHDYNTDNYVSSIPIVE